MVSKKNIQRNLTPRGLYQLLALTFAISSPSFAQEIQTNSILMPQAPAWLTESRVDKVVDHVQDKLEWDIRKIRVQFYSDETQFERLHGFGPSVLAFSQKNTGTIAMGPRIDTTNFDQIFGHELVHMILYQKYKIAIPGWLEEGLANFIGQNSKVDYAWLASQAHPDVRTMSHPFKSNVQSPRYQYQASTALIEMLNTKCDGIENLLQLSVGSKLENYIATTCEIPDVNLAFVEWLHQKAAKQN